MAFEQPRGNGTIELIKLARQEMIGILNFDEALLIGRGGDQCTDFCDGAVLVLRAVNEEFRFLALREERKIHAVDWSTDSD